MLHIAPANSAAAVRASAGARRARSTRRSTRDAKRDLVARAGTRGSSPCAPGRRMADDLSARRRSARSPRDWQGVAMSAVSAPRCFFARSASACGPRPRSARGSPGRPSSPYEGNTRGACCEPAADGVHGDTRGAEGGLHARNFQQPIGKAVDRQVQDGDRRQVDLFTNSRK
jgi:hypothetical protein